MKLLLLPDLRGKVGGPGTFQGLLSRLLERRGVTIQYDLDRSQTDALLLINASRYLGSLLKLKRQGVRIVQRLGTPTNYTRFLSVPLKQRVKTFMTLSYMAWLRRYFADVIVYQSHFVFDEWKKIHGNISHKPEFVIHNGVDTEWFNPAGDKYRSSCDICIISVEGHQGLDSHDIALNLTRALISQGVNAELLMIGKPWGDVQERLKSYSFVRFIGPVDRQNIPFYLRGADVFVFTDILSAGCPNSVLESLGCGTPVLGYSCGVLGELIEGSAGICIEAEGNPWKGQNPGNMKALSNAVLDIVSHQNEYRTAARDLAEKKFSISTIADQYYQILFPGQ